MVADFPSEFDRTAHDTHYSHDYSKTKSIFSDSVGMRVAGISRVALFDFLAAEMMILVLLLSKL